jgi:hypothetical protein
MVSTCVVVRLPSAGTLLGETLRQHGDARVTAVPTGWEEGPDGAWLESLALVEGLSDEDLGRLLLAWNRRYGRPPHVIGDSFAVRLPIRVESVAAPGMADLMRLLHEMPAMGAVAEGDWAEQWFNCRDAAHAEQVAQRLRKALRGVPGAEVRVAPPRERDLSCWEVLQFAGGVASELEAGS